MGIAAAAVAMYAATWDHFFVSDDFLNLERSTFRTVAEGLALFSTADVDFYRPLARLHFGVLAGLVSDRVEVWNVANTLWHALVALLAARLAASLLGRGRERVAVATGLLFAVHWIHVEPVVWASGVAGLLATAGILAALLLFRRARETGRARDAAGSVAAFAGALMAQETAVAFVPLLLVTTWVWPPAAGRGGSPRRPTLAEAAPYAVLLAAYAVIATSIDRGGEASPYRFALGPHLVKNAAFFALGSFVPVRSWEIQDLWVASASGGGLAGFLRSLAGRPGLALPLLAGALALPVAWRRGGPDVRGGLAWIAAASLPFLPLPGSGERFHYLPSFGACLVLALLGEAAWRRARGSARRAPAAAAAALALGLIVAANLDRQSDWRIAGQWTRGIVERWAYLRVLDPASPVEFLGVPDHHRSAWVFRNGFPSMVRLYWQGRPYGRAEDRGADAPPAYRIRVEALGDGGIGMAPARGEERGLPRPPLVDPPPAPGSGEAAAGRS